MSALRLHLDWLSSERLPLLTEIQMKASPQSLEGKVVLVTGASSGIGRATAIELAKRGARVVASARRQAEIDAVVAEINGAGGTALPVLADINR